MRYAVLVILVLLSLAAVAAAETIRVFVSEGICRSCAANVEAVFRAQPQVKAANFDSDNNMLTLQMKHGQTLGDAKLEKLIGNAGYSVERIIRQE
jgi:cation transport ATPase